MPAKSLLWPTLASLAAMAMLIGLGTWQLERLQWKEGLIARIAGRVKAPPVPVETVLDGLGTPGTDVEYTHVAATGQFRNDLERYLYATGDQDWGWDVLTPLELADGRALLVNRGFVPRAQLDPAARLAGLPQGRVTVTGLVRAAPSGRPWTIPAGDPVKRTWYWPEIGEMARTMFPSGGKAITAVYLDADPIAAAAPPVGGVTNLNLPNRHLDYAMTWFGLAAALMVIYGQFAFRRLSGKRG